MNDPLSNRLQDWAPSAPGFDPAFSARVQARLDATAAPAGGRFVFRRLTTTACVLLGLAIGVTGGLRHRAGPSVEELASAYARSIDPLQRVDAHAGHSTHSHP